ncbi:hypothetical protein Tco_0820952 [Tanacetum coccineum]|uniref:Uncharacterized protein n=1 Tax=Tanacetum coccineum TaxID=301880 RepID=A0ABQ5ABU7_9ASTR
MTTLKFADTHNLVVFLEKFTKSDGFEQIVDFLNAHTIKYALTVNPTIYISCIEQFWTTAKVKTINGEVQLQALVDGKKIIITESIVRRDLQLEDAEGVACLPNATIFKQLTLMGYEQVSHKLTFFKAFFSPQWKFLIHIVLQCLSPKTTAWNEFSSNIASAINFLATSHKFNFSKLIFKSMVKNLDNVGKFFMYLRFIQVFLDKKLEGMSNHKGIYIAPSHTKKIFRNIRRVGKGFFGRVTPLFPTMMVQAQQEHDEAVKEEMDDSLVRAATTASSLEVEQDSGVNTPQSDEDSMKLKELMEFYTKLKQRVLDLENIKIAKAQEITSLKLRVKKSARVISSDEASLGDQEDASKQGRKIDDIDKDAEITLEMDGKEVNVAEKDVSTADLVTTAGEVVTTASVEICTAKPTKTTINDDLTHCQTLIDIRSAKPKVKGVMIGEQNESTTRTRPQQLPSKDKGKAIMEEPKKPTKRKDQIRNDEEVAQRLQA